MANLNLLTKSYVITFVFIYDEKKNGVPTGNKMVGIKYVTKKKNPTTNYYEDTISMLPILLTKVEEVLKLKSPTQELIMSSLQGKKLVIETGFSAV